MSKKTLDRLFVSLCAFAVITGSAVSAAPDNGNLSLPAPQLDRGRPLMQVLKERKSSRAFSPQPVPIQELSNLLWAAFGINRPETGGRTAPSAMNMQEIDVYVTLPEGLFKYDAKANVLVKIHGNDIRALTGSQPFVKDAPLQIVLTADLTRMRGNDRAVKLNWAGVDAAYVSQNIYLYCASEKLATVVRGWVDKPALAKAMLLGPEQEVIFAQDVGYPPKTP